MSKVIVTSGLTKKFGSHYANSDVSLSLEEGAIYGLIGRNGAGKTTLMRMILGLMIPSSGSVEILGKSGKELTEARQQIGSIIETPAFYEDLTAYDNLVIRAKLIGLENADTAIEEALKKVGLYEKKDNKVKSYSLGMRQILGIASAILGNPKILILDEPINGLDPIAISKVRKLLEELNAKNNTTIIISSHILGEMEKFATSYGFIVDGKLVKELSADEVKTNGVDLEEFFIKLAGGES